MLAGLINGLDNREDGPMLDRGRVTILSDPMLSQQPGG